MSEIHVWPDEHHRIGDQIQINVRIEEVGKPQEHLWYRIPQEYSSMLTMNCDPFVLASLFKAMRGPADLIVHGKVSPSLLRNLEEFQSAWAAWSPERFSKIEIRAEIEQEEPGSNSNDAIMAFSGGVDSCYTAYYHSTRGEARRPFNLVAGVLLLGFNLNLDKIEEFKYAFDAANAILASLGMRLIPMVTNIKSIVEEWVDVHGVILASCITLLSANYKFGIISSSYSYPTLEFPYGSNPVTDPLMSSDSFHIKHDGSRYNRYDKIQQIGRWPEVMQHLRVCFYPSNRQLNCCKCEKCIRTILAFRVLGFGLPPCFENDISDSQIRRVRYPESHSSYDRIYSMMRGKSRSESWVRALRYAIVINKTMQFLKRIPILMRINSRLKLWVKSTFGRKSHAL